MSWKILQSCRTKHVGISVNINWRLYALMLLLATSWRQQWMMRFRLRVAPWQSRRKTSLPFPLPQTTDHRWRRSAGALLLRADGRPPRRRPRGLSRHTHLFAFPLLLMIMAVNHSSGFVCEGLFSRWTRQQLQSSVGTGVTPKGSTLTRQSSNTSSRVKKRCPHVHRRQYFGSMHNSDSFWDKDSFLPFRNGRRNHSKRITWSSQRKRQRTENGFMKGKLIWLISQPSRCLCWMNQFQYLT